MSLVTGLAAPFRGAAFIARHRLGKYLVIPLVLNAAVAVFVGWGALWIVGRWTGHEWLSSPTANTIVRAVAAMVIGVLAFIALQPVVSAPFVDFLTEKVEEAATGRPAPSAGFWNGLGAAIGHGILKTTLYLFALLVTVVLGTVTGVGAALGMVMYAVFLAYDAFDYPLGRRGVTFGGKWKYLFARPALVAGYAASTGALMLVPLAAFVVPAVAAAGATLAFVAEEGAMGAGKPAAG